MLDRAGIRCRGRRAAGRAPPTRGSTGSAGDRGPTARGRRGCRAARRLTPVATRIRRAVNDAAAGEADGEARRRCSTTWSSIELDAVAGRPRPGPRPSSSAGAHPVPGQEALHVSGRRVPRRAGVDDGDPAPRAAEHERRAQPGRAAADHHHVDSCLRCFRPCSSSLRRSALDSATFVAVSGNRPGYLATMETSRSDRGRPGRGRSAPEAGPGAARRHADRAGRSDRDLQEHPVEAGVRPAQAQPRAAPADRPGPPGPSRRAGRRARGRRPAHPAQAAKPATAASSSR